jgi:hypothetical protein
MRRVIEEKKKAVQFCKNFLDKLSLNEYILAQFFPA